MSTRIRSLRSLRAVMDNYTINSPNLWYNVLAGYSRTIMEGRRAQVIQFINFLYTVMAGVIVKYINDLLDGKKK